METENTIFKQYTAVKSFEQPSATRGGYVERKVEPNPNIPFQLAFENINGSKCTAEKYQMQKYDGQCINEEPIDLTIFSSNKEISDNVGPTKREEIVSPSAQGSDTVHTTEFYPKRRRKKRKFAYTADGKLVLIPNDDALQSPASFSESKQLEILKAAKSLFSKRTRTLYHWMYPNAAKLQIKAAVSSSWESLGAQEKDFYISQVLGRFGFPQSSLMVNPQLGGIKELPPITETPEPKSKSRELQSAISSIMPENPMPPGLGNNSLTFEEFEEINELTKKRRGRPPGSSNKKHKYDLTGGALMQDFKDDPELSQELEQFATMFNLSKI